MLNGGGLYSEGMGLFLKVLEAFDLGSGSVFEGFFFIVGAAGGNHGAGDAGEFMRVGNDALGFAQSVARPFTDPNASCASVTTALREPQIHTKNVVLQEREHQERTANYGIESPEGRRSCRP